MEERHYRPGDVIVPRAQRARFPHPLRGTALARWLRQRRRWLLATLLARRHNARLRAGAPTIQFFPVRPQPRASMVRICARLGLRVGFDPAGEGTAFAWDDGISFPGRALARLPPGAINGRCLDISKSTVDATWQQVAGYGVGVDPTAVDGPIVVKSEENGNHDGMLVMGPLARRESGRVYQRLIDSRAEDGRIRVTRPLVLGGRVPYAFDVRRDHPQLFHGGSVVTPIDPRSALSADEIGLLIRFAAAIGMDYGELDVLRDATSGLIYVIDANRTPVLPFGLPAELEDEVYSAMSGHFAEFLAARQATSS